jgi:hypothetical protein
MIGPHDHRLEIQIHLLLASCIRSAPGIGVRFETPIDGSNQFMLASGFGSSWSSYLALDVCSFIVELLHCNEAAVCRG